MRSIRVLAASAVAAFALSACGGGHSSVVPSSGTQNNPTPSTYTGSPSTFDYGADLLKGATVGKTIKHGAFNMEVFVNMRDPQGLVQYAKDVNDPKSPLYHHFLTPAQIGQRFGATDSDYAKVANYFRGYHLAVGGWPQHEAIVVAGKVKDFSSAFGVTFAQYQRGNNTFIAPVGTPHLNAAAPVRAVMGLVNAKLSKRLFIKGSNASLGYGETPQQIQRAFDYTGAYSAGIDGAGVNVAIVGTGPISPDDIKQYQQMFNGVRMATVNEVNVTDADVQSALAQEGQANPSPTPCSPFTPTPQPSGAPSPEPTPTGVPTYCGNNPVTGFSTPPPTTDNGCGNAISSGFSYDTLCNPEDIEAQLDTQQIASLAPGANVDFYLGYWSYNYCGSYSYYYCTEAAEGLPLMDAEIQEIIAKNQDDIVSISIGGGEEDNIGYWYDRAGQGFGPVEFATLAAEGMATFVSSGDSGQYNCSWRYGVFCPSYPASDPNVTAVGGVTAPLDDSGKINSYLSAWGDQTMGGQAVGSGGGVSQLFQAPPWQQGLQFGSGYRVVPDVAMDGDPDTGPTVVSNADWGNDNGIFPIGGTSEAAPQMAAMWALVLEACNKDANCVTKAKAADSNAVNPVTGKVRLGIAAPYLYAIYNSKTQYPQTMYDILYGNVTGCGGRSGNYCTPPPGANAMTGYDEMTGVGVPFAGHLINAVVSNLGGTNPNLP